MKTLKISLYLLSLFYLNALQAADTNNTYSSAFFTKEKKSHPVVNSNNTSDDSRECTMNPSAYPNDIEWWCNEQYQKNDHYHSANEFAPRKK